MAKRRGIDAITAAAEKPLEPKKGKPSTVDGTPSKESWAERTQRKTYHADRVTLEALTKHGEQTGESISALINRACRELLERES